MKNCTEFVCISSGRRDLKQCIDYQLRDQKIVDPLQCFTELRGTLIKAQVRIMDNIWIRT